MKKLLFLSFLPLLFLLWCSIISKTESWQWWYYDWPSEDSIARWPVFNNYEWCKSWALQKEKTAYNWYVWCQKDCHDSIDGTLICKEVVKTWKPLPTSVTFDEK